MCNNTVYQVIKLLKSLSLPLLNAVGGHFLVLLMNEFINLPNEFDQARGIILGNMIKSDFFNKTLITGKST